MIQYYETKLENFDYEISNPKKIQKPKTIRCRFKVGDTIINIARLQTEKKPQNWEVIKINKNSMTVAGLVESRWYKTQRQTDINEDGYKFYKTLDEYTEMFPEYMV